MGQKTFKFHLIPSGVLNPNALCIMADGMVLDPEVLVREMDQLAAEGIDLSHLRISQNAQVILPYHKILDQLEDKAKGVRTLGTTGRGVGPCYGDKMARTGIRMGDLMDTARFAEQLGVILPLKNQLLTKIHGAEPLELQAIVDQITPLAERLRPFITDTTSLAFKAVAEGKRILFEGAQATMLDIDSGTYPFVTSSHPVAGGACIGTGVPPTQISQVLGVVKAYTTRVGAGAFPTELLDERGERIRERGHEYGTTTGRPRRCGWLDTVVLRYSARLNGLTGICVGHLDVLAGFEKVSICTGYRHNGEVTTEFPAGDVSRLDGFEPVYEELPGWSDEGIENVTRYEDLPENARAYVRRVEEIAGVPAVFVSVGPGREQTMVSAGIPNPAALFGVPRASAG